MAAITLFQVFGHLDQKIYAMDTSPSEMITLDAEIVKCAKKYYQDACSSQIKKRLLTLRNRSMQLLSGTFLLAAGMLAYKKSTLYAIASFVSSVALFAFNKATSHYFDSCLKQLMQKDITTISQFLQGGMGDDAAEEISRGFDLSSNSYELIKQFLATSTSKKDDCHNLAELAAKVGSKKTLLYLSMLMDPSQIQTALNYTTDDETRQLIINLRPRKPKQPVVEQLDFRNACKLGNYGLVSFFIKQGFYPDEGVKLDPHETDVSMLLKIDDWNRSRMQSDKTVFEIGISNLTQYSENTSDSKAEQFAKMASFLLAFHIPQTIYDLVNLEKEQLYLTINKQNIRLSRRGATELKNLLAAIIKPNVQK